MRASGLRRKTALLCAATAACAGAHSGGGSFGATIGDAGSAEGNATFGDDASASGSGSGDDGGTGNGPGTANTGDSAEATTAGEGAGGEVCNGLDDDGDGIVDDGIPELSCGEGVCAATVPGCDGGVPAQCFPGTPTDEQCNGLDDDCDGSVDESLSQSCDSACGVGQQTCSAGAWSECNAPPPQAESCNVADDDCNGQIDEGLAGCRVGVTRWWHPESGEHFYSVDPNEGFCCGYQQEFVDFYFLYAAAQPQTTAWYRCYQNGGFHHYTTDAGCEGLSVNEGVMGYIGTAQLPGSTALYRSYDGTSGDHFFTTSQAEHDYAVDTLGFVDEGTVGYVW
ncbi:MAG: MopE-related protein [Nannocystaceae bacterium]